MTTLEAHQEAYRAQKAHPANCVDQKWLDETEIDFDAVRKRIEFIGMIYAEPLGGFPEPCDPKEIKRLLRMTDRSLGRVGIIMPFIEKYGVSFDWLFLGDLTTLLMDARCRWHQKAEERTTAMVPREGGETLQ